MAKRKTLGKLPPRYSFILNPYSGTRLSKCPKCDRPTHPRKFALFIHINDLGTTILGKTCRYCSRCELIVAHQDELDGLLAQMVPTVDSKSIGDKYLVMGTVDMKVWRKGLNEGVPGIQEIFDNLADFKEVLDLHYQPAGWYRDEEVEKPTG